MFAAEKPNRVNLIVCERVLSCLRRLLCVHIFNKSRFSFQSLKNNAQTIQICSQIHSKTDSEIVCESVKARSKRKRETDKFKKYFIIFLLISQYFDIHILHFLNFKFFLKK